MQAVAGLVESGHIQKGLAIGTDTAQSKPHDALEYTSASAGVAFIFWDLRSLQSRLSLIHPIHPIRRIFGAAMDHVFHPMPGVLPENRRIFAHVIGASQLLLQQSHVKPGDVTYCVFHMPNARRFPAMLARRLGFTPVQLAPSLTVDFDWKSVCGFIVIGACSGIGSGKARRYNSLWFLMDQEPEVMDSCGK